MRVALSILLAIAACSAQVHAKTCKVIDNFYDPRGPKPAPLPVAQPRPMAGHSQEEASADFRAMMPSCAQYVKNMYFNQDRNYLWCLAEHGFIRGSYRIFVPAVEWNCWFLYPEDHFTEVASQDQ